MVTWRPIVAGAMVCAMIGRSPAQQYGFIHYTTEDGLAQSQVRAIAEDDQGFLWFGTVGGASRFDGSRFIDHATREGLPDPQVAALHRDVAGVLWLASGQALLRWTGTRFVEEVIPPEWKPGRITAITSGPGRLVLGTENGGVIERRGGSFIRLDACPPDSIPAIRALLLERSGALLIGSRNGLWRARDGRAEPVLVGDGPAKSISALTHDRKGTLWVGTQGDGLYGMGPGPDLRHYTMSNGLLQDQVRCLLVDELDRLWIGSKFGVNRIEDDRIRALTVHQGLPGDNIFCLYLDGLGQVWLGTDGSGVLRYTGERFVTFTTGDGLCSDLVMSAVIDAHGDPWLGTYGNGVCRLDAMAMITTVDGLPNNTVWSALRDSEGRLWFGTSDGLCRVRDGMVELLGTAIGVPAQRTFTLFEDHDGVIWCGQREALVAIHPGDSTELFPAAPNGPGRSIRSIKADERGRLWMATDEGIVVKDGAVFARTGKRQGLSDERVFCLEWDRKGRLWAGTANGLCCLASGQITCDRLGDDFGSNYVNLLLCDANGRMWAGTNNGLHAFDPDSLLRDARAVRAFDRFDGLRSKEFNQNAAWMDAHGRLYFGSAGGLIVHDPARTRPSKVDAAPVVYISGLRSFLNVTDWRRQCDSIDGTSGLPVGLHLSYRRNHLTFDYGAVNTAHPRSTLYRYRLLGYDPDLLPATDARFASYSNLPHGEYTFEVVASADGRRWSRPAAFTFRIDPPYWLRWWFFGSTGLGLVGLGFGVMRYRALRRARREKTRQLMLRSRMLQLEQQALNANMNRHFVFNALNSIQYYINRQDRTAANRYLTSFAKLIRKNLDASQSDTTTLAEELERLELYLLLEHMRFKDRFTYVLGIDPAVATDRVRIPAMMLQPYVENSIWHGILPMDRPGRVAITVTPGETGRIRVGIEDDGIGIDKSLSAKNDASGDHISRGIEITKGRADVLRRLELTDIRIQGPEQMHGRDGSVTGTRVVIDLPVGGVMESGQDVLRTADAAITFEAQ